MLQKAITQPQNETARNLLIRCQVIVSIAEELYSGYDWVNVLIIADDPEAPAFDQVTKLRKAIQELVEKVDLLAFSREGIFFNQRKTSRKDNTDIGSVQSIIANRKYTLIIVSLGTDNLKLFFEKSNIMQFLRNSPSRIRMYVFGASRVLNEIETSGSVDLFPYSRPGVAKLTQEFKNAILNYVKKEQG